MNKIINTFKYGSSRVKRDLSFTILSGVAAATLLICSIIFSQMFLFFLGIVFVFVTITMAQTFGIHSVEDDSVLPNTYNKNEVETTLDESENLVSSKDRVKEDSKDFDKNLELEVVEKKSIFERLFKKKNKNIVEQENKEDKNKVINNTDIKRKNKALKKEKLNEEFGEEGKLKADELKAEEGEYEEDIAGNTSVDEDRLRKENESETIAEGNEENNADFNEELDIYLDELVPEEEVQKKVIHQLDEEEVAKYNKKKVKKIMKQYRVKRDHRKVIIDRCEKLGIKQTPAFVWIADKQFNILLIEKEPRHLKLPIFGITAIEYKKKQEANPDVDYAIYKGNNMIAQLFGDYVPDYLHSTVVGDVTAYKNLYSIGPDMRFTNKSATHLFDMLGVEFFVEDKVTTSNKVNIYFKDAYKANILLRDNVYDANGYADRISVILGDMAKSTISYNEFKETLNLMIKNKLITEEFAEHYIGVRDGLKR